MTTYVKLVTVGDLRSLLARDEPMYVSHQRARYVMECNTLEWEPGAVEWLTDELTHPRRGGMLSEDARRSIDETMLTELLLFDCAAFKLPDVRRTQLAVAYWGDFADMLLGAADSMHTLHREARAVMDLIMARVAMQETMSRIEVRDYGELDGYTIESQEINHAEGVLDAARLSAGDRLFVDRLLKGMRAEAFTDYGLEVVLDDWGLLADYDLTMSPEWKARRLDSEA